MKGDSDGADMHHKRIENSKEASLAEGLSPLKFKVK